MSQRRAGSVVPASPEIRPNLISVKWLSKLRLLYLSVRNIGSIGRMTYKAIWCSNPGLGALVDDVEREKW